MGEDGASNGRSPVGSGEGKPVIDAEKGRTTPTKPKMEAGAEGSSLAPSQFTIPVATTPNHLNHHNTFIYFRLTAINIAVKQIPTRWVRTAHPMGEVRWDQGRGNR